MRRCATDFAKNPDADAGGVDDMRVEEIVRDYLTKNPEILVAMTTELDKRQQDDLATKQRKIISENADALFSLTEFPYRR